MKILLISLVPAFLIFILLPGKVMLNTYIDQKPRDMDRKVGQSAIISCSVPEDIDIREIHFQRINTKIFSLTVQTSHISSILRFSGTFEKFQWIIDDGESTGSYICKEQTEMNALKSSGRLKEKNEIDCPSPDVSSTSNLLVLNNGSNQVASLWINPRTYYSRLDISGTIRNVKVTLNNLNEEDTDSYECTGKAEGITEELKGIATFLTVRSHGIRIHTGKLGLAFAMALVSCLFK
ncbi:uncharacterized protein [Eleutherodactylus coqui]|uniref:uncharacterized protein n=1 Tax=Eleutherodactylus coqui TaxID=57060 RepID=UPI0034628A9D